MRDYYCNQKFYQLNLDFEKRVLNSCCKSDNEVIDTKWLEQNPGQIFNTPNLLGERKNMLNGGRVASCEKACWLKEEQGLWSRRTKDKSYRKTHTKLVNTPTHLDLQLSSECRLACSYCCKQYSSTWRNDIVKHGDYDELLHHGDRYKLNNVDRAITKLKQKKLQKLKHIKLLSNEINVMSDKLDSVTIGGGEPFQSHQFVETVQKFTKVKWLTIHTGLGVSESVLKRCLDVLSANKQNVTLQVSAESTGANFEFNRYGSKWETFLKYIDIIKKYNIEIVFNMTYANLNVMDFVKFNTIFESYQRNLNLVYEPNFLSAYNLDDETKDIVIESILNSKFSNTDDAVSLLNVIKREPDPNAQKDLSYFVAELCKRRENTIAFMPVSFRKWINVD